MKIFVVRHGESTWNAEGRYQGRKDPPLSPLGEAQARALAQQMRRDPPQAIVTSPLLRARATAQAVANELGAAISIDERLTEISHGEWEGLLKSEVERRWPRLVACWRADPAAVRFPGGESLAGVRARWRSFLKDAARFPSPLLVVTHEVVARLAALDAGNQTLAHYNSLQIENAAVNEFDLDGDRLVLVRLNDGAHLGALRSDPATQAL